MRKGEGTRPTWPAQPTFRATRFFQEAIPGVRGPGGNGWGEAEGAKNQDPKGFLKPAEAEKAVKILLKMGHSTHLEKKGRGSL